jgi:pyruvate/2-oxoglutarate dehydrogenase complex dihydrolipoamide acyltransferase (E2) component
MVATRLGVVVLSTSLLLGCSKETPPAAEEPRSASNAPAAPQASPQAADAPSAAVAAAPADSTSAAPTGAAKFTDTGFDLSLEAPKASVKAGQPGSVEVVLAAKAPFHVNDKYPIKLKLKETPGVKYDNLVIGKDAVKLEPMKAVMPVSFTAAAAGKHTVAGQFAFSVCTEDKCLMEKRDLVLDVMVE